MKYTFTGEIIDRGEYILRRIKRLNDGLIGGWIESELNLSQLGNCFVYDEAVVCGRAEVTDDAEVRGKARVWMNARVRDNARVFDSADVSEYATIERNAIVKDKARILGFAVITHEATVCESACVTEYAEVTGESIITDSARVQGNTLIRGQAIIKAQAYVTSTACIGIKDVIQHSLDVVTADVAGRLITVTNDNVAVNTLIYPLHELEELALDLQMFLGYNEAKTKRTIDLIKALIAMKQEEVNESKASV